MTTIGTVQSTRHYEQIPILVALEYDFFPFLQHSLQIFLLTKNSDADLCFVLYWMGHRPYLG